MVNRPVLKIEKIGNHIVELDYEDGELTVKVYENGVIKIDETFASLESAMQRHIDLVFELSKEEGGKDK